MHHVKCEITCAGCAATVNGDIRGTTHSKLSPAGQRHARREAAQLALRNGWTINPYRCRKCNGTARVP